MIVIRRPISWTETEALTDELVVKINAMNREYDVLLGIARGGMYVALMLSQVLDHGMTLTCHLKRYPRGATASEAMPEIIAFPSAELLSEKRILLIDEVWEKGHSIIRARQEAERFEPKFVDTAVLHFKPGHNVYGQAQPTYYAEVTEDWIDYPWEQFAQRHAQLA